MASIRTDQLYCITDGVYPTVTSALPNFIVVGGDTIRMTTARTPASAAAPGNAGELCWDSGFMYLCTGSNTWKRVAIATWP